MNKSWEKIRAAAIRIGVSGVNLRQWKCRGYVPTKWHFKIIKAAGTGKEKLTLADLNRPI